MWQKGKYGLYISDNRTVIYWPDETGWHVGDVKDDIWLKNGKGWSIVENRSVFKGAALVAPLNILFWEKERCPVSF